MDIELFGMGRWEKGRKGEREKGREKWDERWASPPAK